MYSPLIFMLLSSFHHFMNAEMVLDPDSNLLSSVLAITANLMLPENLLGMPLYLHQMRTEPHYTH